MIPLSSSTLRALPSTLAAPSYDRARVRTGIVHLGVGGFHRAHQAMYLDRLMSAGQALDWGICGVGVLPADRRMHQVLTSQDCLYTLLEKHPDGTVHGRVIGSVVEYLLAPDDPDGVVEKLAEPATRIVSLTITEGGYHLSPATGRFDPEAPPVRADLRANAVLATAFGLLIEALARRRARGVPPFTVLSCDNLRGNGDVARQAVTAFAALRDPALAAWVAEEVAFPNTMVDRITPGTTAADVDLVTQRLGVADAWPVVCEPFAQWVVEDRFPAGRPPFELAGAQLVDDVEPYEVMKLRLLNGGHQALAYLGHLAGHRFVHEACGDALWAHFLRSYLDREVTPSLPPLPGVDLAAYKRILVDRFGNPAVADPLARLCARTPALLAKYVLPVVRAQLATGGEVHRGATIVAAWARLRELEGAHPAGDGVVVGEDAVERAVFAEVAEHPRFAGPYREVLASLRRHGARATLARLVEAGPAV